MQGIPREQTLILDIDGGKVVAPDLWNPYVPGNRRDQGFHQALMEPLFILNYMTGKINPWLGESFTPNKDQTVWTLKLNKGANWNDGKPVSADDVVFTVDMLKKYKEMSNGADMQTWVKSIKKIDAKTVEFTLTKPNPRFQLDYFSVKIWGGFNLAPKHVWDGKDPLTFKNYEKGKSPVYSGPYKLTSFNADGTEFIYDRDDNWWGAKSGFKPLPAPKRLILTWARHARIARGADGYRQARQLDGHHHRRVRDADKRRTPRRLRGTTSCHMRCSTHARAYSSSTPRVAPWNDAEMRWAINYAMDRDQIVQIAYEGTTTKSRMPLPHVSAHPALGQTGREQGPVREVPHLDARSEEGPGDHREEGLQEG